MSFQWLPATTCAADMQPVSDETRQSERSIRQRERERAELFQVYQTVIISAATTDAGSWQQ